MNGETTENVENITDGSVENLSETSKSNKDENQILGEKLFHELNSLFETDPLL